MFNVRFVCLLNRFDICTPHHNRSSKSSCADLFGLRLFVKPSWASDASISIPIWSSSSLSLKSLYFFLPVVFVGEPFRRIGFLPPAPTRLVKNFALPFALSISVHRAI